MYNWNYDDLYSQCNSNSPAMNDNNINTNILEIYDNVTNTKTVWRHYNAIIYHKDFLNGHTIDGMWVQTFIYVLFASVTAAFSDLWSI